MKKLLNKVDMRQHHAPTTVSLELEAIEGIPETGRMSHTTVREMETKRMPTPHSYPAPTIRGSHSICLQSPCHT